MSNRNFRLLVPKEPVQPDHHRWATVTQASPLRILLDGETTELPFTPNSTINRLIVGDRVLVLLRGNPSSATRSRRVIIIGRAASPVPQMAKFTAPGAATFNVPARSRLLHIRANGAGGQGGGSQAAGTGENSKGSGGGGGEYAEAWIDAATLGATVAIFIGSGGSSAGTGANGSSGGDTTFGSTLVIARGGDGGVMAPTSPAAGFGQSGGIGGTGGTGDILIPGGDGGSATGSGSLGVSGIGGASHMGSSVRARSTNTTSQSLTGNTGKLYGGGGGGALTSGNGAAAAGGPGASGICVVETIF